MLTLNKIIKNSLVIAGTIVSLSGCEKLSRPALGDYPKDTNPPGGPLKFYAAMDGSSVDSIRANFGNDHNASYVEGIKNKSYQGGAGSYIVYGSANDFPKSTSITVSFWMKKNGPQKAGSGTQWVFGMPTTDDIWHRHMMFLEFEDAGNPSTVDSAAAKFLIQDQWFEFTGNKRLPHVLDNQWHHLAFVYDQTTSKLSTYLDGVAQYPNNPSLTNVMNNGSPRGPLSFTNVAGLVIGGPGHYALGKTPDDWMHPFDGAIDQFRLYGKALTASEIQALFAGKL